MSKNRGFKSGTKTSFQPLFPFHYRTPSRQFPIGSYLSLPRRLELLAFAASKKAWIVEDDYDSEFRYSRAESRFVSVCDYLGSMSKALFPSLRIGYVVLPTSLLENFATLRAIVDEQGPVIDQDTRPEFIESGAFFRHIGRSLREYVLRLKVFWIRKKNLVCRFISLIRTGA